MSNYEKGKARAIEEAMEFQNSFAEGKTWYWSELAEVGERLEKLARRYGLVREFKENGII